MGYLYTTFVIIASVALKNVIYSWWDRFKEREALKPTPMKLRRGVYVSWGIVHRVERALNIALIVWLFYIAALIGALIYKYGI